MPNNESKNKAIVDEFIAPTCNEPLEILYKDDDILLINKPRRLSA